MGTDRLWDAHLRLELPVMEKEFHAEEDCIHSNFVLAEFVRSHRTYAQMAAGSLGADKSCIYSAHLKAASLRVCHA